MKAKLYEIAVRMIPNVGDVIVKQLISYCGSAEAVFNTPKGKLLRIPGIGEVTANAIKSADLLKEAEKQIEATEQQGIRIIHYLDKDYPEKLKHIANAPSLLYYKGNASLNFNKVVSIVGTRKATNYGKDVTETIVEALAKYDDLLIVSGLAYGIDIAVHRACLKYSIPTIGVLANGLDRIYPSVHAQTAEQMLEQGGLLTENKIGVNPDAHLFPERNRIVAGMADAIIVVEAAVKGGALITANIAQSYDREVFAVPGNLGVRSAEGCNHLIRDYKAHIYTKVEDLEYVMQWNTEEGTSSYKKINIKDLPSEQKIIAEILLEGQKHIDEISFRSQIPINRIASLLLEMEFDGLVRPLPGKQFSLIGV